MWTVFSICRIARHPLFMILSTSSCRLSSPGWIWTKPISTSPATSASVIFALISEKKFNLIFRALMAAGSSFVVILNGMTASGRSFPETLSVRTMLFRQ